MGNLSGRVRCCGAGAEPDTCTNTYQRFGQHQTHGADAVIPVEALVELDDMMQSQMFDEHEQVHIQLVYRPEEDDFQYMVVRPRPVHACAPAPPPAPPQSPANVWSNWLHERVDYGEPW